MRPNNKTLIYFLSLFTLQYTVANFSKKLNEKITFVEFCTK